MSQAEALTYNLTAPVVMSFPNLHEARAFGAKGKEQGEPKYSANFLFDPTSEDLKAMKQLAVQAARARWPNRDLAAEMKANTFKFPWSLGDDINARYERKGKKPVPQQAGKVVIAGRSKYEPRLAGVENGKLVDYEGDARVAAKPKFYPGVQVLAQFNFVAYDGVGANPDGVTAYLNMVFTTNKGEKMAGGSSAAETFRGYAGHATTEDPTGGRELEDVDAF